MGGASRGRDKGEMEAGRAGGGAGLIRRGGAKAEMAVRRSVGGAGICRAGLV